MFSKGILKVSVVQEPLGKTSMEEYERFLAVSQVKLYGTNLFALMNGGAVPNVVLKHNTHCLRLVVVVRAFGSPFRVAVAELGDDANGTPAECPRRNGGGGSQRG